MASNNSSELFKLELKKSEILFLLIFNSFEIIVGVLSNSYVILIFLLASEMRKRPSDLLIFNLATADLILLTVFQPWLTCIISEISIGKKYYFFYEGLNSFVQLASGHAVFLISLDRFLAVSIPLKYQTWVRRNTVYKFILLFWVLALLIGISNVLAYELKFYMEWLIFWIIFQLILLLSITLMYVVIFSSSFKQGRRIWQRESISESEKLRYRMMLKITTNTFILVCFFYTTYLPVIIYITHSSLVIMKKNDLQMGTRAWIYSFSAINCCFNPVFYVFRTERFKQVCCRLWSSKNTNSCNEHIIAR
jgi:hypothetical protein